jgi:hypothetical protein
LLDLLAPIEEILIVVVALIMVALTPWIQLAFIIHLVQVFRATSYALKLFRSLFSYMFSYVDYNVQHDFVLEELVLAVIQ